MRKIIESTLVSLDGVVESPWEWADFDDEAKQWALANLRGYDGFLMGRGTFEPLRAVWEHVRGDGFRRRRRIRLWVCGRPVTMAGMTNELSGKGVLRPSR